jgi:hypothetical protein
MRKVELIERHWAMASVYESKAASAWGKSRGALQRLAERHQRVAMQLARGL